MLELFKDIFRTLLGHFRTFLGHFRDIVKLVSCTVFHSKKRHKFRQNCHFFLNILLHKILGGRGVFFNNKLRRGGGGGWKGIL